MSKNKIKEDVFEAARAVFKDLGYEKTDMRTIAQNAGIAVGTIYNYYKGKDELFNSIVEDERKKLTDNLYKIVNNPTYDDDTKFNQLCKEQFELIERYGSIWYHIAGAKIKKQLFLFFEVVVAEELSIRLDIEKIVTLFFAATEAMARDSIDDREINCAILTQIFLYGLKNKERCVWL